ncbi:uncharacterized protein LOC106135695 isoform X2 [Amyelois transitella]|uniref:uncharacterized protein LOC106135695 isoform X2 n=1 Tax=Amyelois transitella TaxID=680683 RepID=UPI00067DA15E|nr:uncharacterized protein LOC106135695 isoform X2 [Amyelois transitella]
MDYNIDDALCESGFIFSLPWGYFADTQGRRRALMLSTSVGCLFAMASSFAPNWQTLLVLKFIGSSFSSAGITLTITYLGECTVEKHRSQYMFIMNSANLATDIVLFGLAYLIFPQHIDVPIPWLSIRYTPWRAYLFTMAILLGLGCLMIVFLFESPKFLASVGKTEQALDVLRKMYKLNKRTKDEYSVRSLKQLDTEVSESFWMSLKDKTVPIFKPPLLWRTMQLFYLFAICYSTINVFYMWFPLFINNLFSSNFTTEDKNFCERIYSNSSTNSKTDNETCDAHMSEYTIYSGIFYGIVLTVLNLALSAVAKWRRLVLISTLVISAICLVLINMIIQPIVTVGLFTMVMITGIGIGNVATYFNDMYPTSFRGLATSLGSMTARMASFAGVNIFGAAIVSHCSLLFYCWSLFVISGIAVSLLLPADGKFS